MQVKFTFAAPTTFAALQSLGVDPNLIACAESGDRDAINSLQNIHKEWETRKQNSKAVWGLAAKITSVSSEVAVIRSEGIKAIGANVVSIQKTLNSIQGNDNNLKNQLILNQTSHNDRIEADNYQTGKQLTFAAVQHKANLKKIDAQITLARKKLNSEVRQAQYKAAPGSEVVSKAWKGIANWFTGK